jgi:hypothetical protein
LVDLLDQTGQGAARLADEDQSGQVIVASDGTAGLAGAGHKLGAKPAAIIPCPDRGTGFQRVFGLHGAAEQDCEETNAGDEA